MCVFLIPRHKNRRIIGIYIGLYVCLSICPSVTLFVSTPYILNHHHHQIVYQCAGTGAVSTSVDPFQVVAFSSSYLKVMADLKPDHTRGLIVERFHSWQFLSVSHFQVILGLPGPCFPSICVSKAVLSAPLERSTCPYQRSLLSFTIRSRLC